MGEQLEMRQELLLAVADDTCLEELAKLLFHVSELLISSGRGLLRGDVVPLAHPVVTGGAAAALYASLPVVFPDGLATLKDSMLATVFVWLIPLHSAEAEFVASSGWSPVRGSAGGGRSGRV